MPEKEANINTVSRHYQQQHRRMDASMPLTHTCGITVYIQHILYTMLQQDGWRNPLLQAYRMLARHVERLGQQYGNVEDIGRDMYRYSVSQICANPTHL
jgi:hypothetical protein